MGKSQWLVAGLLAFGASAAQAQAQESGNVYIAPFVGYSHLRLDEGRVLDETETLSFDALHFGATLGYRAPFGLIVEIGRSDAVHANLDWFDDDSDFSLTQTYGAIGWQVEFADGWHVTPRIGRGRWVLGSDDRVLLDSAGENHHEIRGWDNFWEVGLMRDVSSVISMGLNFKDVDQEFGHTRTGEFSVRFRF